MTIRIHRNTDYDLYAWCMKAQYYNIKIAPLLRDIITNTVCNRPISIPKEMTDFTPFEITEETKQIKIDILFEKDNPVMKILDNCIQLKKCSLIKNIIRYALGKELANFYLMGTEPLITSGDYNYNETVEINVPVKAIKQDELEEKNNKNENSHIIRKKLIQNNDTEDIKTSKNTEKIEKPLEKNNVKLSNKDRDVSSEEDPMNFSNNSTVKSNNDETKVGPEKQQHKPKNPRPTYNKKNQDNIEEFTSQKNKKKEIPKIDTNNTSHNSSIDDILSQMGEMEY